eukprot:286451-Rhodomonas_salina.4
MYYGAFTTEKSLLLCRGRWAGCTKPTTVCTPPQYKVILQQISPQQMHAILLSIGPVHTSPKKKATY